MNRNTFTHKFLITIALGLGIGLITFTYFSVLLKIQLFHETESRYIFALPVVLIALIFIKKRSLFFPTKISHLMNADQISYQQWSPWGFLYNLIGSWLSHLAGASLGREGTVVVLGQSMARLCRLEWIYWRPIVMSIAFSAALGSPWVGLIFMFEMFSSKLEQKLWVLIGSWVAVLFTKTFNLPHLLDLSGFNLNVESFNDKFLSVVLVGSICGVIAWGFKLAYFKLDVVFKKYFYLALLAIVLVTAFMAWPEMITTHSLSLGMLNQHLQGTTVDVILLCKIILTLLCVSLGFIGGEFVPSVVIGTGLGVFVAKHFGLPLQYCIWLGTFCFFSGLTRLKWTSIFLAFILVPTWNHLVWVYWCYALCQWVSGRSSVYR